MSGPPRKPLSPREARTLAYDWQGGPTSPLYAFASSGLVLNLSILLAEISANQMAAGTVDDARDLRRLYAYVEYELEHHPAAAYPWHAPWAQPEETTK